MCFFCLSSSVILWYECVPAGNILRQDLLCNLDFRLSYQIGTSSIHVHHPSKYPRPRMRGYEGREVCGVVVFGAEELGVDVWTCDVGFCDSGGGKG